VLDVISLTLSFVQFRSDPSLVNGLGLAYDAIATGVPFLPAGVGTIKAAVKVADTAGTVARSEKGPDAARDAPVITAPYKRPSGATTKAQRESVQAQPCVDCGTVTVKQVADHRKKLVEEYYETGAIDKQKMRSLDAVQSQCPSCSARQGAEAARYSRRKKQELGL
jgi:hypothetical protein